MVEDSARDVSDQRKEFLENRSTVIGATDSPKILGFSRWGTALTVYNDKVNPDLSDRDMSLPAWLGLKMQATVGELYTAATGVRLRADNRMHRMAGNDFIGCHLDFRAWGKPGHLIECKTRAYMSGWGDEGTTQIPVEIWVQVQHEMMVTDAELCDVAVLFGHHTFRFYSILRDQEFITGLLERLTEFREQNWLPRVPPLPTGHDLDTDYVKSANPDHDEEIKPATPEQVALVERFRLARQNAAQAKVAEAEAANRVRDLIGTAAGISGAFGTITWKRTKDSEVVHWDQVAVAYRNGLEVVARQETEELAYGGKVYSEARLIDLAAVQSIYTELKPGYRRMNVQFAEEES